MSKLIDTVAGVVATIGFTAANAQEASYFDDSYFVDAATGPAKTRAQVVAETREAARPGVIGSGQLSIVILPAQTEQIRLAGLQAVGNRSMARAN